MKIGVHARENLDEIIARKMKEIETEGVAFWGYGGNTCHPSRVRPFAEKQASLGQTIFLCMERMDSHHFAEPARAQEYSVNGAQWEKIPKGINVLGSRFALAIRNLREETFDLPLARTVVATGPCQGRRGNQYIAGRVDKAVLELDEDVAIPPAPEERVSRIGLVAELADPFAVYLRNT
jgi:hypothetical protein